MKKTALIFLLAISFQNCFAQSTTDQKDEKLYDHYIGAQINGLLTHLFNSSANSLGTGNPYLITYSMNNKKTGWGIRVGIGCNFVSNSTANTNGNIITNNNDLQFRAGIEKTFEISNKWTAGTGVDLVFNYNDDNSTNNYQDSYSTSTTVTKTKLSTYGGGPFGKVNYHLTNKILIGTECSFYYVTGNSTQTIDFSRQNSGMPPTATESKSKPDFSRGYISLPIVIYLLLKF